MDALSAFTVRGGRFGQGDRLLRLILRDDAALGELGLALRGQLGELGVGGVTTQLRFRLAEQRLVALQVGERLFELRLNTRAGRS